MQKSAPFGAAVRWPPPPPPPPSAFAFALALALGLARDFARVLALGAGAAGPESSPIGPWADARWFAARRS
eukprot:5337497-Alexandrium_andersonii.AAC.1